MKKIITTIIAAAAIATAQAQLTPKQFAQLKGWAANQGYSYQTVSVNTGTRCFLFQKEEQDYPGDMGFALVPTSSDTVNEAINAFIASAATVHAMETVAARNKIREQWSNE